ncbi:MAG: DNA damage-inducible protein D [Duncaniella sp.]|nr:DNA damage-inducible protein D [Duncaniella sp.]
MTSKRLSKKARDLFESIRRLDEDGNEYWTARDISKALGYAEYRNFLPVARKAWSACYNSGVKPADHFVPFNEMVSIGSGAERQIDNIKMTRYACYITVQNADPSKTIVAQAQTYFAIQTRRAEKILDGKGNENALTEDEQKRLVLRREMSKHNNQLASAAKGAGVSSALDYAIFQNHGYRGLYGGLDANDIRDRKGLTKSQNILDHMGSTELAANLFRATQTEDKLRREGIVGKNNANRIHHDVGAKVRDTIRELGGTMPENLPTADSIKKLENKEKHILKSGEKKDAKDSCD